MNVGDIQRGLSLKAERLATYQFDNLYRLLCYRDWLRLAHDYVAQNAGSQTAGGDGLTMKLFDENLETNLDTLRQELQSETFEPYPVRRI